MATQRSATVRVTNNSGGNAWILISHNNSSNGTQSGSWTASPGETVGSLTAYFETGVSTSDISDYWSVLIHVKDGPAPGFYVSAGPLADPHWTERQLQSQDADSTVTFSVSATEFEVALESGRHTGDMNKLAPHSPVTHVFVVMLENHSFDNMFAMSGIPGIIAATTGTCNSYKGQAYCVRSNAPLSMPTDPGHEFLDVLQQLTEQTKYHSGEPYPPISNSGFATNYATSTSEGNAPLPGDIGDIMACFATPTQLPVIYQLATQFAICDHWYSSLPGPTWPNRFFLHGASSSGLDDSPSSEQMSDWETSPPGFQYPNGSIYDSLRAAGIPYRFYNDSTGFPWYESIYSDDPGNGSVLGAVPQVSSIAGVHHSEINYLSSFASDLQGSYPYPYTFIEPHYGDVTGNTYAGGSSQHPMDDVYGGENLLSAVYSAIRNSPYWDTSLLIVTYDEHGGFFDGTAPPPALPPGDNPNYGYNKRGFDFKQYGVRVPAVIVSPLIPPSVDHTPYDHASVLKTLERLFGRNPLTQRDASSNDVLHLLSLAEPRQDCPTSLGRPAPPLRAARPPVDPAERARIDAEAVPRSGNLAGALLIVRKTEIELSGQTPAEIAAIDERFNAIQTRGQARAYADSVMEKVEADRQQRELAARRRR